MAFVRDYLLLDRNPLPMTYATSARSTDDLGAEWWDHSLLDPKEQKHSKVDLDSLTLPETVRRDIAFDGENLREILPEEYRFVNDTANLLVDRARMYGVHTEAPHDQVDLFLKSTANYIQEDQKYYNVFPGESQTDVLKQIRTGIDALAPQVEDAMEGDMIMGDGAPG